MLTKDRPIIVLWFDEYHYYVDPCSDLAEAIKKKEERISLLESEGKTPEAAIYIAVG